MEYTLTKGQQEALDFMMQGKNVFLTGEAGTGKSFVVNAFIETVKDEKNILITAPTGIAAIHIGGVTLHRSFQAKTEPMVNKKISKVPNVVQEADIIIIDEISMCRIDLFDYVARVIVKAEEKCMKRKQLIVVGDFFQLPPVSTPADIKILKTVYKDYDKGFAFESSNWKDFDFTKIYLKEIMRQEDSRFIEELNKARIGNQECVTFFNRHASHIKQEKGIVLCSTNKIAKKINEEELANIKSKKMVFKAKIEGDVKSSDHITDEVIELKVGARVMMLINDNEKFLYQNGSMGEVIALAKHKIDIRMDETDNIVTIEPHLWKIERYDLEEAYDEMGMQYHKLKKETIGKYTQLPIKLAYAITVHKSQGQTYDKVNLIPYAFDCGQLYVALSRVKTMQGLSLLQTMRQEDLICHKKVLDFYDIEIALDETKKRQLLSFGMDLSKMEENLVAQCPQEIADKLYQMRELIHR